MHPPNAQRQGMDPAESPRRDFWPPGAGAGFPRPGIFDHYKIILIFFPLFASGIVFLYSTFETSKSAEIRSEVLEKRLIRLENQLDSQNSLIDESSKKLDKILSELKTF